MYKAILLCVLAVLVGAPPAVFAKWKACGKLINHIWHEELQFVKFDDDIAVKNIFEPITYLPDQNGGDNAFVPAQTNVKPRPEIMLYGVAYELQTFDIHSLDSYHTPSASVVVQLTFARSPPTEPEQLVIFVVPLLEDHDFKFNKDTVLQRDVQHLIRLRSDESYETNLSWMSFIIRKLTMIKKPPIETRSYNDRTLVFLTVCMNVRMLPLAALFVSSEASPSV